LYYEKYIICKIDSFSCHLLNGGVAAAPVENSAFNPMGPWENEKQERIIWGK
jgi:hypothetical protein